MDPDGFGFDSLVNYVCDSHTQMNSPSVRQVISLLLTEKSKLASTAAFLDLLRSGPALSRQEAELLQDEWGELWLDEWTDETETVTMNRGAGVTAEGTLFMWIQRLLCWKGQNEHNGTLVQVKKKKKTLQKEPYMSKNI